MTKTNSFHIVVLLCLVSALVLSAAAPAPVELISRATQAKSELVRLTIVNNTTSNVYLRLSGPAYYYLVTKGGESGVFTVQRGTYDSWLYACGASNTDELDLTTQKKLIMPVCGGKAGSSAAPGKLDLSTRIRVVRFKLVNDSDSGLLAIFTGASTYVFSLARDESQEYTINKGEYSVKWFACSSSKTRQFESYPGSKLVLRCPQEYRVPEED